jgi:hypothetical protein
MELLAIDPEHRPSINDVLQKEIIKVPSKLIK